MINFEASTFLLQWAVGGAFFLWITGRQRLVGLGYGWTTRVIYFGIAALSLVTGLSVNTLWAREFSTILFLLSIVISFGISIGRRKAGVGGQKAIQESRVGRVSEMLGRKDDEISGKPTSQKEFPPVLDLLPPAFGLIGLIVGAVDAGGPVTLSIARTLVGAAFLGAVSNSMLLGHWYLVQPGLSREPIHQLVRWTGFLWLPELILLCIPTGMFSVLNGTIDDNYNGLLGWFWVACVVATICLVGITRMALKEKEYSAVMAATGLMYLAILTGFGMDLVARILLDI
ncbi:MAG: hypothetical protein QF596_05875 [Acidimicrobiales bacterium]|jgi:hypothetical protein|nr:hypothetical protein [Acidimicrobiales bacterium]MDP6299197.1 hypothetical protein [Acidimicrobiales bacterium]HJM27974.1 hypothetical protein [Acidimicrobiales bacterium]HJM97917.1 hypothetical protein [Acidimicrobiales bacterium]